MSQLGASEGTVFDAIGLSISGGSQPKMAANIKSQLKVIRIFHRILQLDDPVQNWTCVLPCWTGLVQSWAVQVSTWTGLVRS